ncbi:MAG: TolC family protein [Ignavibacteria bacterium]
MKKTLTRKLKILALMFFLPLIAQGQTRDIIFYLNVAEQNSPLIKQNKNLIQINLLQNNLIYAQNIKPQVYLSSDYLFAPYFNNEGKFISITPNPDPKAFGYDPGVTNGGLYEALLNVDIPLLNSGTAKALINQNNVQNKILLLSVKQSVHDLQKQVIEQYINTYSLQQQMRYLEKIIKLIDDRKKISDALTQKGLMQQSDFLLLDIEENSQIIEEHQQKQLLEDAFTQLNNLCGIDDTTKYELAEPALIKSSQVKYYNLSEKYKFDSISIAAQEEVINSNYKPQLNLLGNVGLRSTDPSNIEHHFGTGISLHLNIPIYNGNQKSIAVQQNKISFDTLITGHSRRLLNIKNGLRSLGKQISALQETIRLYELQIEKQELLLNILQDRLISGQISTIDYVKSIQDYIQTNQNLSSARVSLLQIINQYNYLNW